MPDQCVIAEYDSAEQARIGLEVLENDGFTTQTVSVVSRQKKESAEELAHWERDSAEDAPTESRAGLGMLLGGGLAAPIAAFTMVGPIMIAGPIAGMAAGAAVGGLLGRTHEWGVHETARDAYERRVREGAVLVIVNDEPRRLKEAESVLSTTQPRKLERFAYSEHAS